MIQPLVEYFSRTGALWMLAFILLYKIGDTMASAMSTPFYLEVGFSNTEIGAVIESPVIAEGMARWFDENIEQIAFKLELRPRGGGYDYIVWHGIVDGQRKTLFSEPYIGFWRRFGIGLLGLLPVQSQL